MQDLSAVKESWLPIPEDRAAREVRRLSTAQKKEEKDAAKKHQVKKTLEREALKKLRRQQSLEGLPIEESPFEMVSGEDEDSSDDDARSWYDTVTFLVHLPDVRPLLEPVGGRLPRGRGKSRRLSRGKESQQREGPKWILQRGELPHLGSHRGGWWRRSRKPDRLGLCQWAEQQRRRPRRHRQA
jgi:hypothetical protein